MAAASTHLFSARRRILSRFRGGYQTSSSFKVVSHYRILPTSFLIPPHTHSSVPQDLHGKYADQHNSSCFFLKEVGLRSWQSWLKQAEAEAKDKVKLPSPSLSAAAARNSSSMVDANNVVCRRY